MKKEKFITVMAVFDDRTQERLQGIQKDLEQLYGEDTKTKGIPFHITLGSYAVEDTAEIVSRIVAVAGKTGRFDLKFTGLRHFGNVVRYMEPEMSEELLRLHLQFDSDYANGYSGWKPHATVYRHSEPTEIELPAHLVDQIERTTSATVIGIELGEFFPPKKIVRVLFER